MPDPIQQQYRAMLNGLASGIDEILNGDERPKRIVFTLVMAEVDVIEGGRVNYISNGSRDEMLAMTRESLARAEGRYVDQGGRA